jgi:hypothetical protein
MMHKVVNIVIQQLVLLITNVQQVLVSQASAVVAMTKSLVNSAMVLLAQLTLIVNPTLVMKVFALCVTTK